LVVRGDPPSAQSLREEYFSILNLAIDDVLKILETKLFAAATGRKGSEHGMIHGS
jgi:hypothetical protein